MTERTQCLITGCALIRPELRLYYWGDLHQQGDRFIFVSVLRGTDRPAEFRLDHEPQHDLMRALCVPSSEEVFLRANVFVMRAARELLTTEAWRYIGSALPHEERTRMPAPHSYRAAETPLGVMPVQTSLRFDPLAPAIAGTPSFGEPGNRFDPLAPDAEDRSREVFERVSVESNTQSAPSDSAGRNSESEL